MKALFSLLFIFVFTAELTHASSSFIRSSSEHVSTDHSFHKNQSSVHSALPLVVKPTDFWNNLDVVVEFAEITIPCLQVPRSRIDRPPCLNYKT